MDRELRPVVAGEAPARFLEDELPVAVVEAQFLRLDGERGELFLQAELGELAHAVRQKVDAHAQRPDLRRGLENLAADARLVQRQREREPADAAADDQHLGHGASRR
ncbi:hypothetical protein D3C83_78850 [compost metagenome]